MITLFEFGANGVDVVNERIKTPTRIIVNTSLFSQSNCSFALESREELDVTNNETFAYIPQSKEIGGVFTKQMKKGKHYLYEGKTFRRMLNDTYLHTDRTQTRNTHLIFNTANDVLEYIFKKSLPFVIFRDKTEELYIKEDLLEDGTKTQGIYKYRYTNCYAAAMEIIVEHELKLKWKLEAYDENKQYVVCELHNTDDFTQDIEINKHMIDIDYTKNDMNAANHLIALGRGEMEDRYIYELWRHDVGDWRVKPKVFTEEREVTYLYDYPNVEDDAELRRAAKLKTRDIDKKVSHSFDLDEKLLRDTYSKLDVGDKILMDELILISAIEEEIKPGDMAVKRKIEMGTKKGDIRDENFVEDFNKM